MSPLMWMRLRLLCHLAILALAGCATAPGPALPSATLTSPRPITSATSSKSTGKLSARLETLANSPGLRAASIEEQARALSLPTQGAGSLMRDEQGRLFVNIRLADVSETTLQELRAAGAVTTNISERYRTVTAFVAPADLIALANLAAVESVAEELAPERRGGAVVTPPP